jgi:hypothetical protein
MEKVWVVMLVKNEEDIIGYNLSHWLSQGIDGIIVSDNMSHDTTIEILNDIKKRAQIPVVIIEDFDPAHYQSRKTTAMMNQAANEWGANIIIPCDSDELFYSQVDGKTVSDVLRETPGQVFGVQMWNHFCTMLDAKHINPFKRMVWRTKERNALDKVAVRYNPAFVIDEGNHRVTFHSNCVGGTGVKIGIRHFPYRSAEHFVRKAEQGGTALAAATELSPTVGLHWRQYKQSLDEHGAEALKEHYRRWFTFDNPLELMTRDPAPYQGDL